MGVVAGKDQSLQADERTAALSNLEKSNHDQNEYLEKSNIHNNI